uniref:Uncharacterized protein n=1 Tax=Zooxanthella nutricula TaxID=1333877 RepID=A0A7S2ICQ8_9DINO
MADADTKLPPMTQMRGVMARNKFRSLTAAEKSFSVKYHSMTNAELSERLTAKSLPGDIDYMHHSHATRFARGGISPGQGLNSNYFRDARTGVWFKESANMKTYLHTGDESSTRYHDAKRGGEHGMVIWSAPCAGNFWVQKAKPKPKSLASTGRTFSEPWMSCSTMKGTATMAVTR